MKILELTNYSAGIDGVFARVKQESLLLAKKGHEVRIFSTNHVKGSSSLASPKETLYERKVRVEITRFPARKLGGESFMLWNFKKGAIAFNPGIIIAHAYRHHHTLKALKIAKNLNIPILLVTHAPFGSSTRSLIAKIIVFLYDNIISPQYLNKFSKVLYITPWELKYLKKLVPENKLFYSPNGISEFFFKQKPSKEKNKVLYFGRISPIKNIETLIRAFSLMKSKSTILEIAGSAEETYLFHLKKLAKNLNLQSRISFNPVIYDIKEKIKKLDSASIYVLPSLREGMPQSLIEAMSRKKIVIASSTLGAQDIIKDGKNGFIFSIKDALSLAQDLDKALYLSKKEKKKIQSKALSSVKQFSWKIIIENLNALIKQLTKKN